MSRAKNLRQSLVVFAVASSVASSVAACHKSSEQQAEEAASATAVKEVKEQRAYRELERGDLQAAARALVDAQEADERAARKQVDVAVAVAREQARFRTLLTKELAWVDRRIAGLASSAASFDGPLRAEKESDVSEARAWRDRLQRDLDAIDHPPPGEDWSTVKRHIRRELDENRPASLPSTYEKSYGI